MSEVQEVQKIPLVLFSGGLDSSFMLQHYLKTTDVDVLYVGGALGVKMALEFIARKAIIKALNSKSQYKVRRLFYVDAHDITHGDVPDGRYSQPIGWLSGALTVVDPAKHSVVAIGYLHGEGILSHTSELFAAWNALSSFTKWETVPLSFPLANHTKQNILDLIDPELLKLAWVCERPRVTKSDPRTRLPLKYEPCCVCSSCLTLYSNLTTWGQRHRASHVLLNDYMDDGSTWCTDPTVEEVEIDPNEPPADLDKVFSRDELKLLMLQDIVVPWYTDEELTVVYNRSNNIYKKNPPISTKNIFSAMRFMIKKTLMYF